VASILLALSSSPDTAAGQRALALADSLADQGHALTLCCLQDAVLLASSRAPAAADVALARLLDRGARCLVLGEDLALRGLRAGPRASTLGYPGLVAALAGDHDRVIGAF